MQRDLDKSWCSKSNVRILKIHPVPSQGTTIQAMASIGAFRGQCRRRAACCLFQKSQLVSVHTLKRRGGGGAAAAIIAKTRAMPCRGLNAFELSSSGNALPLSSPTHPLSILSTRCHVDKCSNVTYQAAWEMVEPMVAPLHLFAYRSNLT